MRSVTLLLLGLLSAPIGVAGARAADCMNLGESIFVSNLQRPATVREGITCVVCHRVAKDYGKVSGRFGLHKGDIFKPAMARPAMPGSSRC